MASTLRRAVNRAWRMWQRALSLFEPPFPEHASADQVFRFTLNGIKVDVPRFVLTPEIWRTLLIDGYEAAEVHCLADVLRPGDTVLEFGAGIGVLSSFALRHCKVGRVIAIEANPHLIPVIERTHALNGVAAEVVHAAVTRTDGEVRFNLNPAFWSSSTEPMEEGEAIQVHGLSLSGLLATTRPDVVVVDIEGGEATLFDGIDLSGVRCVVVEVHRQLIGLTGIANCFAALAAAEFAYDPATSSRAIVTFRHRGAPV